MVSFFKEGLNPLYHLSGAAILGFMAKKFPSISYLKTYKSIQNVKRRFGFCLKNELNGSWLLDCETLKKHRLLKDKYAAYATFLAAISSYPILYQVASTQIVEASIFSKTAMITSIKLLDNINDQLHNFERAVASLRMWEEALTSPVFFLNNPAADEDGWLVRAENSAYMMARWAYNMLPNFRGMQTFKLFISDVRECIDGQVNSFYQKKSLYEASNMNFKEYLNKVTTKASGTLWVDVDLLFYEMSKEKLDCKASRAVELINRGIDLLFRALILWDDVTDLQDDLRDSIVNSAMMLGLETGRLSLEDLKGDAPSVIRLMEERGILSDVIHLGNLVFLSAVECLQSIMDLDGQIDSDALVGCARVLRLFLLRKLISRKMDFRSLSIFLQSLDSFERIRSAIPDYLWSYGEMIVKQD